MTDQEIIAHLQNEKYQKAVNGLYKFMPTVKNFVLKNSGTSEDAKDIFQDALVVLYKKVNTEDFALTVSLNTYMVAIAKHVWWQELRKRNKMPMAEPQEEVAEVLVNDEPQFSLAEAAFHLLGEKCKQLLTLFYFQKKSFREIATMLAFSDEHVAKNQKYRCIQKAKENFSSLSKTNENE
jgi:RNA polymerase sigma factor (sigma-70 family)